ncbi:DUF3908 domain-containing protein [Biomaibacter acetigenes]|uniref:DUF3908 domain-containing protein n=1 Tax=Biomaibacter acetigenes TaxID=2316383 RepID=A0A3G2R8A6_9FIRM|nr:DUF3908 family protein [Biomaibacter acetigenes]AYO31666.1 DUF3908 domain-containing protein [Biomaibacter acetigenes]
MMNIDFREVKEYYRSNLFSDETSRQYAGMFEKVSQIVNENDILYFYPKYLFVDEQTLQLYLFLKNNKFIKVWINDDKQIVIECFNTNEIKNFAYECPLDDYGEHKLTLFFEKGIEGIEFNSKKDTNENWKYKFDKVIYSIVKYFVTTCI